MNIQNGRAATFHYKLMNETGEVVSASPEDNPLTYIHGTGSIVPGLEKELDGKSVGDKFSVTVSPEDGYGERNPELIAVLRKEAFQGFDDIAPGMQFQAQDNNGNVQIVTVSAVEGEKVTVDRNHPLAGMKLYFHISVVDVREAEEEKPGMDAR